MISLSIHTDFHGRFPEGFRNYNPDYWFTNPITANSSRKLMNSNDYREGQTGSPWSRNGN